MKSFWITLAILLIGAYSANCQDFFWAKHTTNPASVDYQANGTGIATDGAGNVYTVGSFSGSVDFDPGPDSTILTTTLDYSAVFITKHSSTGNLIWAKKIGGNQYYLDLSFIQKYSIGVSGGEICIAGYFTGTRDFDPGPNTLSLSSAGGADIFVCKLSTSGNLIWVKPFGGNGNDLASNLTADFAGNLYIAGFFSETVDFDPSASIVNLTASSSSLFIIKMNTLGELIWAKSIDNALPLSTCISFSGGVCIMGKFQLTTNFDEDSTGFMMSASNGKVFIMELSHLGDFVWAKQTLRPLLVSSSGDVGAGGITVDDNGCIYIAGNISEAYDLDPGPDLLEFVPINNQNDIFISKFDAVGNFLWAKQIGGKADDWAMSLAKDASGNIQCVGHFKDTIVFDLECTSITLTAIPNRYNAFTTTFNTAGDFINALQFTGANNFSSVQAYALVVDWSGRSFITGSFYGFVDFNPTGANNTLYGGGTNDAFTVKLGDMSDPWLILSHSVTDTVNCNGNFNGANINLTVNGGCGPYNYIWSFGNTNEDISQVTSEGNYSVTVTDINNNSAITSVQINILLILLDASITYENDTLLAFPVGDNYIYHWWSYTPDTSWELSTHNYYLANPLEGEYYLYVEDTISGCWSFNEPGYIVTDINNIENNILLKSYPNPSYGTVNFEINSTNGTLTIYDAIGQELIQQEIDYHQPVYKFENAQTGLYTFQFVNQSGKSYSGKFVVVKE